MAEMRPLSTPLGHFFPSLCLSFPTCTLAFLQARLPHPPLTLDGQQQAPHLPGYGQARPPQPGGLGTDTGLSSLYLRFRVLRWPRLLSPQPPALPPLPLELQGAEGCSTQATRAPSTVPSLCPPRRKEWPVEAAGLGGAGTGAGSCFAQSCQ